jgi:hypothetical protein
MPRLGHERFLSNHFKFTRSYEVPILRALLNNQLEEKETRTYTHLKLSAMNKCYISLLQGSATFFGDGQVGET